MFSSISGIPHPEHQGFQWVGAVVPVYTIFHHAETATYSAEEPVVASEEMSSLAESATFIAPGHPDEQAAASNVEDPAAASNEMSPLAEYTTSIDPVL